MSHQKYMNKSSVKYLKQKYTTLTSLFIFATVVSGCFGVAGVSQSMQPHGAIMLTTASLFGMGSAAANARRIFYANKLRRR